MKFICFGYMDVQSWAKRPEREQHALMDACFAYDETLKKNGNWVGGEGLQGPDAAVTLRYGEGKVSVAKGPYAPAKDLLGGLLIIEARDLNHAVRLISDHPGSKMGPWEIRPVQDMTAVIRASEQRRSAKK